MNSSQDSMHLVKDRDRRVFSSFQRILLPSSLDALRETLQRLGTCLHAYEARVTVTFLMSDEQER